MASVDRYRTLAGSAATRWGRALGVVVPVELVLAIIHAESSGNPQAVRREPDGRVSRGLMQVLEGTARELGVLDPQLLHVPAIGIDAGVHYLAKQLKRYGGSAARAVAAYNAGSARYDERERFVNQAYVDKVLGYLRGAGGAATSIAIGFAILFGGLLLSRQLRRRAA